MKRLFKPSFARTHTLTCTVALSLLSSFSGTAVVQAAPLPPHLVAINYTPPPPPDRGAPGNRGEGASRGCTASTPADTTGGTSSLIALVPEQTLSAAAPVPSVTQVWGLTSTAHPHFWFFVPYTADQISAIEFVLQNDQDQVVYRTTIATPTTPGILAVPLPETANGLDLNQSYHWFFKVRVMCEPSQAPTLSYLEGWIQRTPLEQALSDRLTQASPEQQAALYAENGIWYDALTALAELKLAQPNNPAIAQAWTELLTAVGLADLTSQPFIQ